MINFFSIICQIRNNPVSSKRQKISNINLCSEWQPYVNSLEQMLVESTKSTDTHREYEFGTNDGKDT